MGEPLARVGAGTRTTPLSDPGIRADADPLWRNPPIRNEPRPGGIMVVGDSHTPGLALALHRLTTGQAHVGYGGEFFRGGTNTQQWGGSWPDRSAMHGHRLDAALATQPRSVVVSLGTNDGLNMHAMFERIDQGRPGGEAELTRNEARLRTDVARIVGRIREAGANPVWVLPPHTGRSQRGVDHARAIIRQELTRLGVTMVEPGRIDLRDKIHATWPGGYATWSQRVWSTMTAGRSSGLPATFADDHLGLFVTRGGVDRRALIGLPAPAFRAELGLVTNLAPAVVAVDQVHRRPRFQGIIGSADRTVKKLDSET